MSEDCNNGRRWYCLSGVVVMNMAFADLCFGNIIPILFVVLILIAWCGTIAFGVPLLYLKGYDFAQEKVNLMDNFLMRHSKKFSFLIVFVVFLSLFSVMGVRDYQIVGNRVMPFDLKTSVYSLKLENGATFFIKVPFQKIKTMFKREELSSGSLQYFYNNHIYEVAVVFFFVVNDNKEDVLRYKSGKIAEIGLDEYTPKMVFEEYVKTTAAGNFSQDGLEGMFNKKLSYHNLPGIIEAEISNFEINRKIR